MTSTLAPGARPASQAVPAPTGSTTTSRVAPYPPVVLIRWIHMARRAIRSGPVESATKFPGRKRSGMPGATSVSWR